ncbi:MAG TPA: tellurite resistance TerB family protein [Candidatus Thermoplasmatota archaeon]|nr:tellurite resistance TerB family protein [Candidatus Thermoplasmatota archaeon]
MGLFDKVLGTSSDKLNAQEGFAGIALCAIAADGSITEEEAMGLGTNLSRMKLYQGYSGRQMNNVFEKLIKTARSKGVPELLAQSAEAVPKELKTTAFAVAADLLFADGSVDASERKFLETIQKSLGVDDAMALKIVEVVQIKNMG